MFSIEGKAVFITGGYQGIGLGTAERFAKAGAKVVIVDIKNATEIAKKIGGHFIYCDVAKEDNVEKALEEAKKIVGKLDVVINNAGIAYEIFPSVEGTDSGRLMHMTEVNHFGTIWVLKHAPRFMNDNGSIINNSSFSPLTVFPGTGEYTSTKPVGISLSRISAQELGPRGIRVNAVCPGYINTTCGVQEEDHIARATKNVETFTPMGRWGTPEDVAGLFHFLAADESSYITGQTIVIDGGWMAGMTEKLLDAVKRI